MYTAEKCKYGIDSAAFHLFPEKLAYVTSGRPSVRRMKVGKCAVYWKIIIRAWTFGSYITRMHQFMVPTLIVTKFFDVMLYIRRIRLLPAWFITEPIHGYKGNGSVLVFYS
jgi:hypothetical protein